MNKHLITLVALTAYCTSNATAGEVTGLTTFTSGTTAKAAEVNGNFNSVKTAVDDNNARITANEDAIQALQTNIIYPIPLLQTGQNRCYDENDVEIPCAGTGQDGDLRAGVPFPASRWIDNVDGTVTDLATGLMWVQNRNCISDNHPDLSPPGGGLNDMSWHQALDFIVGLNAGTYTCGAPPYTDWRLPNTKELYSTYDFSDFPPQPPVPPFTGYISGGPLWTSTRGFVIWEDGRITYPPGGGTEFPFWIVRGPQFNF